MSVVSSTVERLNAMSRSRSQLPRSSTVSAPTRLATAKTPPGRAIVEPASSLVRRLQSHTTVSAPRLRVAELYTHGVYSSYDSATLPLVRTLTITSDEGCESLTSSSVLSDVELSPTTARHARADSATIYRIERQRDAREAGDRWRSVPPRSQPSTPSTTSVSVGSRSGESSGVVSPAGSPVLRIFIAPVSDGTPHTCDMSRIVDKRRESGVQE